MLPKNIYELLVRSIIIRNKFRDSEIIKLKSEILTLRKKLQVFACLCCGDEQDRIEPRYECSNCHEYVCDICYDFTESICNSCDIICNKCNRRFYLCDTCGEIHCKCKLCLICNNRIDNICDECSKSHNDREWLVD